MKTLLLVLALASSAGAAELPWAEARQMVLVVTPDFEADQGTLTTWTRADGEWKVAAMPAPVTIGRNGSAWGLGLHPVQPGTQKREGDGKAPAGVFELGQAFGYAAEAPTAMHYVAMQASHWCIDLPASRLYNRIVDARDVGEAAVRGSTEPMRRDLLADGDQRYRTGLVIRHNPQNVSGAGSCIFAHLWKAPGEPTAGCTAMDDGAMQVLLGWLDPAEHPVFVLLPQPEYERLRQAWELPDISLANPHF
jgi:L,D-peptidoglycan transpeptidase YkuD (ErfK/YbiS/YcfS/YnhG family)